MVSGLGLAGAARELTARISIPIQDSYKVMPFEMMREVCRIDMGCARDPVKCTGGRPSTVAIRFSAHIVIHGQ